MPYADKIKRIDFVLESCETISIERKHIGDIFIGNIEKEIRQVACNSIKEINTSNKFYIELNRNANFKQLNSGGENYYPFEQLNYRKNIVAIHIIYNDNREDCYYVDYDSGDIGTDNINQKCKFNDFGDFYIVIGKGSNIDDIFPNKDKNYKKIQI